MTLCVRMVRHIMFVTNVWIVGIIKLWSNGAYMRFVNLLFFLAGFGVVIIVLICPLIYDKSSQKQYEYDFFENQRIAKKQT